MRTPAILPSLRAGSPLLLGALLLVAAPRPARADAAAAAAEIAALQAQIAIGAQALSTGGCAVACRALASMERAAERICELDPGPRCADARAKVRDASRRVQEACAECRVQREEAPPPVRANEPRTGDDKPALEKIPPAAPPPPPDAPAPVRAEVAKRGGCAGCAVSAEEDVRGDAALGALVVIAMAARRLRRRDARPRSR